MLVNKLIGTIKNLGRLIPSIKLLTINYTTKGLGNLSTYKLPVNHLKPIVTYSPVLRSSLFINNFIYPRLASVNFNKTNISSVQSSYSYCQKRSYTSYPFFVPIIYHSSAPIDQAIFTKEYFLGSLALATIGCLISFIKPLEGLGLILCLLSLTALLPLFMIIFAAIFAMALIGVVIINIVDFFTVKELSEAEKERLLLKQCGLIDDE